MDDLDKQLAQLQLLNNRDLSPKPHGLVKKVGPAVPPKPNKKTQPQVFVLFLLLFSYFIYIFRLPSYFFQFNCLTTI